MHATHDKAECPLCRTPIQIPRMGGRRDITCRNGHRFEWEHPARPVHLLSKAQAVTLVVFVIVIALILAAQHWPQHMPFLRFG